MHAGEKDESDIDAAIALNPDSLIHMTYASKHQIESDIPIVVCPRSNLVTGVGSSFRHPTNSSNGKTIHRWAGTDNMMC